MSPNDESHDACLDTPKELPEEMMFAELPNRKHSRSMCVVVPQYHNAADTWQCRFGAEVYKDRPFRFPETKHHSFSNIKNYIFKYQRNAFMCERFSFSFENSKFEFYNNMNPGRSSFVPDNVLSRRASHDRSACSDNAIR